MLLLVVLCENVEVVDLEAAVAVAPFVPTTDDDDPDAAFFRDTFGC